ncbi:MAG: hypothetical protein K2G63_03330 [Oscillospiraceae bacterium]|nr:hypothetical protein [Oscillospiraceae bacterium]
MTYKEYEAKLQKLEIERREREATVKRILFDKLKDMAEVKFDDCANNEYPEICNIMNEIAKTLLDG